MQTQYEVNNFSRVTLLSNLNYFFSFPYLGIDPFIAFKMELKGRVRTFPVYGMQRIIDLLS
jgi:hypothetical protein